MKWLASLFIAAVVCSPAMAVDFWLTNDPAGTAVADFTVDRHDGPFELYAYISSLEEMDTVRMWTGVMSDIAEIVDVSMDAGTSQANVILPDEVLYGATDIGLAGEFRFATITVNPLDSGTADWASFPVQIIPTGGLDILVEPTMNIVPEPATALLAVMGLGLGLMYLRRR